MLCFSYSHTAFGQQTSRTELSNSHIACLAGQQSQAVHLAHVTDGDTIVLKDGRQVRLIGMNALELNASTPADKRMAQAASDALTQWLDNKPARLILGLTRTDRYGRTLAHLILDTGQLASEALIRQGLALAVSIGENARCATQLQHAEELARESGRGIWKQPGSWLVNNKPLHGHERGFHLVKSTVTSIKGKKRRTVLHLTNNLQVIVGSQWRALSEQHPRGIQALAGRLIEVKGWLRPSSGTVQVTLHHPSNLRAPRH